MCSKSDFLTRGGVDARREFAGPTPPTSCMLYTHSVGADCCEASVIYLLYTAEDKKSRPCGLPSAVLNHIATRADEFGLCPAWPYSLLHTQSLVRHHANVAFFVELIYLIWGDHTFWMSGVSLSLSGGPHSAVAAV